MTERYGLSKSKLTAFEQCPKRLWLSVHRPDAAQADEGSEGRFAAGNEVGAAACALYPDGIMVAADAGLGEAISETKQLIAGGWSLPVFEATFAHDGVLVRVDLMLPAEGGAWHVAEVKSSTGVKDYHVRDLATQIWVLKCEGVDVASASIRHVDRDFRLTRAGDFAGLFRDSPQDHAIVPIMAGLSATVLAARDTLSGPEPHHPIGDHCHSPFPCDFHAYCGRDLPPAPEWPVSLLPDAKGKTIARRYAERGILDLREVPAEEMLSAKLARVHRATVTGEAWHDAAGACAATDGWASPRHYLDFETIAFAVPRWIGTGPWQQVPFQFSCHSQVGDAVIHTEFLTLDGQDPRRGCAEELVGWFTSEAGRQGAVIAYNAAFERRCLADLAVAVSDLSQQLLAIRDRVVDLLPIARDHYYHPDQRGSWSIKAVLPTVSSDRGYGGLTISDGGRAQGAYLEAIAPGTTPERRAAIDAALREYCARDTEAMIILLNHLRGDNSSTQRPPLDSAAAMEGEQCTDPAQRA